MIGTRLRGLRHGANLSNGKPIEILFFMRDRHIREGVIISTPREVYIFNRDLRNVKEIPDKSILSLYREKYAYRFQHTILIDRKRVGRNEYSNEVRYAVALPDDFEKQYAEFCESNKKLFKSLGEKVGYSDLNNPWSKYVFCICGGSKNFFAWAHNVMARGCTLVSIEMALRWNENYQQMVKKLKKGTITAYTDVASMDDMLNEMSMLRRSKRVADVINMFNTAQKKALREIPYSDDVYETMSRFSRLSPLKKNNFIRKMSTVEDPNEILHQMAFLADVHFKWNKESLMEYLANNENLSYELKYDKGDVVLLMVNDYDTVKRLAKNTNWCISKNKQYWNNYMSPSHIKMGTRQYVLFDFSKKEDDLNSIIGFTVTKNKGITASHNFTNTNILDKRFNMTAYLRNKFETLVPEKSSMGGIHTILAAKGIDINTIISTNLNSYEWNSGAFFDYLSKCIPDDSFDVLSQIDDKVSILIESDRIGHFLGKTFANNFDVSSNTEYMIFADFSKDPNDPNKLLFCPISYDRQSHEASVASVYNQLCEITGESFDSLLDEYDLPYDIICRADDPYDKAVSAFSCFDWRGLNTVLKLPEVRERFIKSGDDKIRVFEAVNTSIFRLLSTKFLEAIYGNELTLTDMIGRDLTYNICNTIVSELGRLSDCDVTDSEFDALINNKELNKNKEYVALCYVLKMILTKEPKETANYILGNLNKRNKFVSSLASSVMVGSMSNK